MSFYCLCESPSGPDSQVFGAPNRYCAVENSLGETAESDFPPVALRKRMKCISVGANQVILAPVDDKPNDGDGRSARWRKHYPNVDVFECEHCHARIVRE